MKTITDAVNEFKAEFNNGVFANHHKENYKIVDHFIHEVLTNELTRLPISSLVIYSERCNREDVAFIGTRSQFEYHVKELTGCPIKLKQWQDSKMNKLVYTKAMQDAGEQIKVGMKFRTEAGEYIAELVNDLSVCFTDEFGFFVGVSIHVVKGIDTRADKEKAIDDIYEEMYRRMRLKRPDDGCLCGDDTQVGVEFLIEYMDLNFPNWAGK